MKISLLPDTGGNSRMGGRCYGYFQAQLPWILAAQGGSSGPRVQTVARRGEVTCSRPKAPGATAQRSAPPFCPWNLMLTLNFVSQMLASTTQWPLLPLSDPREGNL